MANGVLGAASAQRQVPLSSVELEARFTHDLSVGLSVDELLAHCGNKLRAMDMQIRGLLSGQNNATKYQGVLAKLDTQLNRERDTMGAGGDDAGNNAGGIQRATAAYDEAIAAVDASTPEGAQLKAQLVAERAGFVADAGDQIVSKEDMEKRRASVGDLLDNLKNGDQMRMLKLQSAVEERGRVLSMFSNMIAKMNESSKAIIQNMAR